MNKPISFEQSQDAIDAITSDLTLQPEKYLYYALHDLASDLIYAARQLKETGELEPAQLKFVARRALAAYVASEQIFDAKNRETDEKIQDILRNPHRTKGMEMP
ncbi:hypothetical protein Mesil_1898 [Allomeiothermus silvanus DSM 9946]|uniref:Uncharacterized protein n=1 Tax=Allomeiothermus silvanus (strain ATCC 700542 / DSM 9946 / NBRC 106475 / NCIMB 13440 / VI-R2) TaxID=526227 RepID=D7BGF7_ALLS1|nr:hypothetical protein [Allomeiothermus silvanus]ADH63773.1 hypothetical protein Mesil_1898 [Allomeiothermus silvanus DSM 9946]